MALTEKELKRLKLEQAIEEVYIAFNKRKKSAKFNTLKSNKMDYNKLALEIHQAQKDAGWYDNYRSDNTLILLIKSELFEAFEAYRKYPKIEALSVDYLESLFVLSQESESLFIERFKENIKDSFADELADLTIRLLDFAGYQKLNLWLDDNKKMGCYKDVIADLISLDYRLTDLYYDYNVGGGFICSIIKQIQDLAELHQIYLERHIKLKLAYNKTRSKRHGNKIV